MKRITLLCLLLLPDLAAAQSAVTKAELREQDRRTTERQLKDQLWSIFEPVDERRRRGQPAPRAALRSTWLSSHSYAASVPGLCRIDSVMLHFAPVAKGPRDAETPVRAFGLDATAQYHFRTPPKGWYQAVADNDRSRWDRDCAGLKLREQAFFSAPDDQTATDGSYAVVLALRAVADRKIQPGCGDGGPFEKRSCAEQVAGFDAKAIAGIERCEPVPSRICYEITDAADRKLRVVVDGTDAVQSVELEQMIIIADALID